MKIIQNTIQMALFTESPAVPQWSDLDEAARSEVKKLLVNLLVTVKAAPDRTLPGRRTNDE